MNRWRLTYKFTHPSRLASRLLFALTLCLISTPSCKQASEPKTAATKFEIEKDYSRGPMTLRVGVSNKEISIAERITLSLEVKAAEDCEVTLPEFGEKLEQFGIVNYSSPPPKLLESNMVLYSQTYELEPFLSGEYKIPPMKVLFWKRDQTEEKKHELESEELTITVTSLLPENASELQIKDIVPPVELQSNHQTLAFALLALAFIAVLIGAVLIIRKRRKKRKEVVLRPPHELAYDALEALLKENLVDKGEIKEFYNDLSHILRHYIENRFGLHAPERTTEEFLDELRSANTLVRAHKELLTNFLKHCDLVKFAELNPSTEEIQSTFDACKKFIAETKVQESLVPKELQDSGGQSHET